MAEPVTAGIAGAGGRLGTAVRAGLEAAGIPVVLTVSRTGRHGERRPDVLVDVSSPAAWPAVSDYCEEHGVALVECVSNLSAAQGEELRALSRRVPVVRATNLALGNHLQRRVVASLAALLKPVAADVEATVWERHPVTKVHQPSATAVELAGLWGDAEVSARRAGLPVSEHELMLTLPGQVLVLRHHVTDLSAAAAGALAAVRWAAGRGPGMSTMDDVYGDLFAGKDFGS